LYNASNQHKKSVYISTHEVLSRLIAPFSDSELALVCKHSHPLRKVQDRFCYIHSTNNGSKIFKPLIHNKLESCIRNNIKLFHIYYTPEISDDSINRFMIAEANHQKKMLQSMAYLLVIINRNVMISYFLSYSYSRSADYFKYNGISNG
ncbi:MAG: hypothetical protein KAH01_07535, partial [Caldisericia bacterium]|nr:hypothetical protein [Caldisericia bacterium]